MSSSVSGTVINYGFGSGSDFLTSYGSGYGSGPLVKKLRFLRFRFRFRFRFHNTARRGNLMCEGGCHTSLYNGQVGLSSTKRRELYSPVVLVHKQLVRCAPSPRTQQLRCSSFKKIQV
jgi:hypothetical protein